MNTFNNPVKLNYERNCLEKLEGIVSSLGNECKRILILTWDEKFHDSLKYKYIENSLKEYDLKTISYSMSNPDINDLFEIYSKTNKWNIDLIISIGGGSVLDIGKSLVCLYEDNITSKDELRKLIRDKNFKKPKCKWIGVPTTFGTGSEVTCWATIWDRELNCKLSLENQENYAYAVFVDPEFAESIPKKLMISSALDATAHALEAYWSNNTNPVSRIFALEAISSIMNNIENLIKEPKNIDYQEGIANGSMLAGMAFSNTKTTACHAISYPLTLKYGIPHGVAVSILIESVLKINKEVLKDGNKLCVAFNVNNLDEIGLKIKQLLIDCEIPCKLSEWGAKKDDIEEIVDMCFTKGRIDNNPIKITKNDIVNILNYIY